MMSPVRTSAACAGPRVARPTTTILSSISVAYSPSHGRGGRVWRPNFKKSSKKGFRSSIRTTMLWRSLGPFSRAPPARREPTSRRVVRPAELKQFVKNRFEIVDRNDHVETLVRSLLARALELQRADAEEIAGRAEQRGAAPVRMRGRGEDRLVEHVFPVAGEFLLADDARRDRALAPARAADDDLLLERRHGRIAERQRRQIELGKRLH